MKQIQNLVSIICLYVFLLFTIAPRIAHAAILDDAETVYLKQQCGNLDNCFTELALLNSWLANTRKPGANNPLIIKIGPGTFTAPFLCVNLSHITIRGSGRSNSIILGNTNYFDPGMDLKSCDHLNVSHLKIVGHYGAIWWDGTGTTTWNDVEVEGNGRGWYEFGNCDASVTKHTWINSRIKAVPLASNTIAYSAFCGSHMIHSSELQSSATEMDINGVSWGSVWALWVQGGHAIVQTSSIRTVASIASNASAGPLTSIKVKNGTAKIQGSEIEVISTIDSAVESLVAETGGLLDANTSTYHYEVPAGVPVARIMLKGGNVYAPMQWSSGTEPPEIISITGADTFIETDCSSTGCTTSGNETHFLTYQSDCILAGPWRDAVTGTCRGM